MGYRWGHSLAGNLPGTIAGNSASSKMMECSNIPQGCVRAAVGSRYNRFLWHGRQGWARRRCCYSEFRFLIKYILRRLDASISAPEMGKNQDTIFARKCCLTALVSYVFGSSSPASSSIPSLPVPMLHYH